MSARRERVQGLALLAPSALALGAVSLYPLGYAVWLSLERRILVFGEERFIGLSNYAFLLRDGRFWSALGSTLYFTFAALAAELLLGLALALLMNRAARGRGLVRAAVLVPWAIPTVVAARVWAWLYNADYGLLSAALPPGASWLGTPGVAMPAAILVDVWKTTPFVALLLLAGLQGIPDELYQAARLDGASAGRILWSVTLPLLRPVVAVTAVLRGLDAFRVFDAVYVLTGGGPANTTETLSIYAYKTLMRAGDFGYGNALAVATFACAALLAAVGLGLLRRRE